MSDSLLLDFVCEQVSGIATTATAAGTVIISVEWNDEHKGKAIYGIATAEAKAELRAGRDAIKKARGKWLRERAKIDAK